MRTSLILLLSLFLSISNTNAQIESIKKQDTKTCVQKNKMKLVVKENQQKLLVVRKNRLHLHLTQIRTSLPAANQRKNVLRIINKHLPVVNQTRKLLKKKRT